MIGKFLIFFIKLFIVFNVNFFFEVKTSLSRLISGVWETTLRLIGIQMFFQK